MKILFILQYVPYPLNSGGNQAMFNMLDCIRKEHEISLLFYLKSSEEEKAMEHLQALWTDVTFHTFKAKHLYPDNRQKATGQENLPDTVSYRLFDAIRRSMERKINRRIRKIHALQDNQDNKRTRQCEDFIRTTSCLFNEIPGLQFPETFHQFVYDTTRKGFDLIQIEFYECLTLVYLLPQEVKKVFVQHEIRYVRNQNAMNLFREITANDILQFNLQKGLEQQALACYDKIIALTETDRQIMLRNNPALDIYVSPAAVKMPQKAIQYRQAGMELVFIGNGTHFPNADGLMWFCKEVLPLLSKEGFRPKLNVTGEWNKETQQMLQAIAPDISFTGFVEDLPAFVNGKISIVPIRIGSGMRMKILDSIFAASPVVTTSKGCEGLPLEHEKDCYIADSPQQFAQAVASLLSQPDIQEKFANHSLQKFTGRFNTAEMQKRRLALYELMAKTT